MAYQTKTRSASYNAYGASSRTSRMTHPFPEAPKRFKIMFTFMAGFIALTFLAVIIIPLTVGGLLSVNTVQNCKVIEKSTAVVDGYSEYRVHTSNCGTFSVEDSILDSRYDSADMYGAIQNGETYDFETRGKRVPVLSMSPNIINAKISR